MKIDCFQMERTKCLYENEVKFNLSESGVLPLRLGEHFGIGRYLRVGFGYDADRTRQGLRRIDPLLDELREKKAARKK